MLETLPQDDCGPLNADPPSSGLTTVAEQLIQNQLFDWVVREFVRLTKRAEFIDGVNSLALCHYLNPVCFNECGEWKISESRSVQIGRLVS
jgi:hypothetical protein